MADTAKITKLENVVIRFAGDSGDGMQLTGTLFSTISAIYGNEISTFPDYPAEIRAPQGSLSGVSGYQVHIGTKVYTPGDLADVLVAMNPAALKVSQKYVKKNAIVITDADAITKTNLTKAKFTSENPFDELCYNQSQMIVAPITSMVKSTLEDSGMDMKGILKCKNMFALGLLCWLFNSDVEEAALLIKNKFSKKPAIYEANKKVLMAGYNYGHNTHANVATYSINTVENEKGTYADVKGNQATAWGLIAASEKSGLQLFLGSYPITPASDILHELAARKDLGVITVQAEDEIAGISTAIGASYAGKLAATSTSGPGIALKGEALGLAVMTELPLVVINVQRGGPSTGLPTKAEQTDLMQALYGRNGECPLVVMAALTPSDCFDAAFSASKIALEHMTPVILMSDAFIANGSSAWKLPDLSKYPEINPPYVTDEMKNNWSPYNRNPENHVRYWAKPGMEGFMHRVGGLEKDSDTGVISTQPENHEHMVKERQAKIDKIADYIPKQEIVGSKDADLLVIGWGGTYGHLLSAVTQINKEGYKVALAQFKYISPLPSNTEEILRKYKKIVVCELNNGQFSKYLRGEFENISLNEYHKIQSQPFSVSELVENFKSILNK